MTFFLTALAGLDAVIIAITIAMTLAAYPTLPARVPVQFNWDGSVRSFGSRLFILLPVAIQLVCAVFMAYCGYGLATHAPGTHGTLPGFLLFTVCFNALLWRTEKFLITAANGAGAPAMRGFFVWVAVFMVAVLLDARFIG